MIEIDKALVKKCLESNGSMFQLDMMIEEAAELTQAIQHFKRGREHNIQDEIADVLIMAKILRLMYDPVAIDEIVQARLKRLVEERLK